MRKLLYLFFGTMAMGLWGACTPTDKAATDNDSTLLRLAVLPTMDCLPFYYADSMGIFETSGLHVELVTFGAAMDADTAFMNGSVDGIATDLVKACVWQGMGDTAQVAMVGELRLWLITAKNARLLKAESLKEKIIGITRHSALDYFTDEILASVKLQSTELNKPQINNLRIRNLMVDQDQMDGAIMPEPYASEAVARGAKRLTGTSDLNVGNMMCVLFGDSVYRVRKAEIDKIRQVYDAAVLAMNKDSLANYLPYFPKEHSIEFPDSLFSYKPLKLSVQYNDSMLTDVRKWAKGRGLIK